MLVKDLHPSPKNPRTVTPEKLKMLKAALSRFGDLSGVVFNRKSGQLVGGHQRTKVFADGSVHITMKYDKPTRTGTVAEGFIELKGERFAYREVSWDKDTETAANIAANKGAGEWDMSALGDMFKSLDGFKFDMDLTMFDESERAQFFPTVVEGKTDEDAIPSAPKVAKTKLGDVYRLGEHRLMCGDSTDPACFDRLMGNRKADIAFTSPPYNLGTNAKLRGKCGSGAETVYTEKSDHKSQQEYLSFISAFTQELLARCKVSFVNIQMLAGNKLIFPEYWYAFRDRLIDVMIWDKEHGAPNMASNVLNSAFEFIFIFSADESPTRSITTGEKFHGTISNIFRLNPNGKKEEIQKGHGAVFPVQFPEFFITNFSKENASVLEPFGGTGSTMIACEKTKRRCLMMELDPIYCDVIVQRWEQFTGEKAVRQSSNKRG